MLAVDYQTLLAQKEAEIAALREELSAVRDELRQARTRSDELLAKVTELAEAVAKGNERIGELLVIAQRKKRASKPEKPKAPPPPPPTVGDEAAKAFTDRPTPPEPPGVLNDRPRPKQIPTGRKPLPTHLSVDDATLYPALCPCGCGNFEWVDEVVEEKLDVQAYQRIRRTVRKTGRCRDCGQRTTAEAPPSPFPRSKVSCAWLAWFIIQKFLLLVPLDRIRRYLGAQGVVLAESFLVSQVEWAADIGDPIDGEHWKDLLDGTWMASDGTGFEVQIKGVGLHHGYIEVYHRRDVVVYQYEAEKGGETQASKLGKFEGTLLVDGESRYNETTRENPLITEANCNAHPRRKLRDAEVAQPVLAVEGGRFVSAMFDLEAEAKKLGLVDVALLDWRQTRIKPLAEEFRVWIDAVHPTLTPSDPLAKVLQYYKNHWTPLMHFLAHPEIPIDNSGSERLFQSFAKLRLNCLFAGGTEGAHRIAVLLGLVATCQRIGVDPQGYLEWLFIRRGTHREKYPMTAAELTPAAYKKALSATAT